MDGNNPNKINEITNENFFSARKRITFHCFRKMFLSASIDSGIGLTAGKKLCGKTIAQSDDTYLTVVNLKAKFIQIKKFLTIKEQLNHEIEEIEPLKKAIIKLQSDLTEQKTITSVISEGARAQNQKIKEIENKLFSNQPWVEWEKYLSNHPDESEQLEKQFEEREKWEKDPPKEVKKQREQLEKRIEEYEEWQDKHPEVKEQEEKMFRKHDKKQLAEWEDKMIDLLKLLEKDKGTKKD